MHPINLKGHAGATRPEEQLRAPGYDRPTAFDVIRLAHQFREPDENLQGMVVEKGVNGVNSEKIFSDIKDLKLSRVTPE